MRIQDKTALITGAARGIGQATARELAAYGVDIIGLDLRRDDLRETEVIVTGCGRRFTAVACDLSELTHARKTISTIANELGGFDILINNAGILPSGPFMARNFEVWQKTIEINLLALMNFTHSALPFLVERKPAHIVNIASIAGKFGTEGVAAYAASKHGVVGFSSALRSELTDAGVGVSWICPSPARTRMAAGVVHGFLTPVNEPERIARAVRKAIQRNSIEVFVPAQMRFTTSILPALSPRFARWILRVSKASQGWMVAQKDIEI